MSSQQWRPVLATSRKKQKNNDIDPFYSEEKWKGVKSNCWRRERGKYGYRMLKDYGGHHQVQHDLILVCLLAVLTEVHDGRRFPHDAGGGSGRCADFTWDEERLLGSRHWPTGAAFLVIGNTVLVLIDARVFPVFDFLLWRTFSDDDRERVQTSGRLEAEGLVGSRFASLVF